MGQTQADRRGGQRPACGTHRIGTDRPDLGRCPEPFGVISDSCPLDPRPSWACRLLCSRRLYMGARTGHVRFTLTPLLVILFPYPHN